MANVNLVNLNDAVYLVLNRKFDWLNSGDTMVAFDINNFSRSSCPLLYNHDRREVVTYKDWAAILAGNQTVLDTTSNRSSRCAGLSCNATNTLLRPWGRTFGKPAGAGGRPLAEVKPLDEMFWYYDALNRCLRGLNINVSSAARLLYWYYNASSGWLQRWTENGSVIGTVESYPLEPGVYGALSCAYAGTSGFNIRESDGTLRPFMLIESAGNTWRYQNSIFFVDSPVTIEFIRTGYNMGQIFRFTPPGYWC